jgi:hypothetical protein
MGSMGRIFGLGVLRPAVLLAVPLGLLVADVGCGGPFIAPDDETGALGSSGGRSGGWDNAGEDSAPGGPSDAEALDTDPGPPLTLLVTSARLLVGRVCDVDGDGSLDNAVADLGGSMGGVAAMAVDSLIGGAIEGGHRLLLHFPAVADPAVPEDPEVALLLLESRDIDDPVDLEDDFSGEEAFVAIGSTFDGCGEPRHAFRQAVLEDGAFTARAGVFPLDLGSLAFAVRGASVELDVAPWGESAEGVVCGYMLARELGAEPGVVEAGDLSALEDLLAGGAAFGVSWVPGLVPDVDLDGDGLESFLTDEQGHIVTCVDGDTTTIEGRDCYADPRIADGFSIAFEVSAVGATYEGRAPEWEDNAVGECEEPPKESLFDPR